MEQTVRQTLKRTLRLLMVLHTCEKFRNKTEKEKKEKERKKIKTDLEEWIFLKPKGDEKKDSETTDSEKKDSEEKKQDVPWVRKLTKAMFTSRGGIIITVLVFLLAGMVRGGFYSAGKGAGDFGLVVQECKILFLIASSAILILCAPDAVDKLYRESNLQFFMTMPFRPMEIVAAKYLLSIPQAYRIMSILVLPMWLGFCMLSGLGFPKGLTEAVFVAVGLMPLFTMAVLFLLVIFAHAYVRRLVPKNPLITVWLPVAVILLLIVVLAVLEKVLHIEVMGAIARGLLNLLFFNFAFASMINGHVTLPLVFILVSSVLMGIVFTSAVRLVYQKSLLYRWDLGNDAKKKTDKYKVLCKEHGVYGSYIKREIRTVKGMKVYRLSMAFSSVVLPVLLLLIFGALEAFTPAFSLKEPENASVVMWILAGFVLPLSLVPAFMNKAVGTAFSRDVYTVRYMLMLPVMWEKVMEAKLIAMLHFASVGSTPYVLFGCLWLLVKKRLPFWGLLLALLMNLCLLLLVVETRIMWDIIKPRKEWKKARELVDNKGDLTFLLWIAAGTLLPLIGSMVVRPLVDNPGIALAWIIFFTGILPIFGYLVLMTEGLVRLRNFLDPPSKKSLLPNFIKKSKS